MNDNVIEPWFPRSIDRQDGGFTSGFDHRWRPVGAQDRLLEFQARQTRSAALLGVALPAEPEWRATVVHGVQYLDGVMRDRADGGWFAQVSRAGEAQVGKTKDAHGTAYLISAGVEAHRLRLRLAHADSEPSALHHGGSLRGRRCLHGPAENLRLGKPVSRPLAR